MRLKAGESFSHTPSIPFSKRTNQQDPLVLEVSDATAVVTFGWSGKVGGA
jgi:hypothetical protein